MLETLTNPDPVLFGPEAAAYLGLTNPRTLDVWRNKRRFTDILTPTFVGRKVGYRRSVLEKFLRLHTAS